MTVNFSLLALDALVNTAAALRYMSGGQFSVPLVVRMATGAGRQLAAQHSHSFDGWFAHVPGLKVLAPGTVDRCALHARRRHSPTRIRSCCSSMPSCTAWPGRCCRSPGPEEAWRAAVRRPGRDISLFAWGGMLPRTAGGGGRTGRIRHRGRGAWTCAACGRSTRRAILESVRRTRRALVVDEAWRTAGLSAELVARIAEAALYDLDAPSRASAAPRCRCRMRPIWSRRHCRRRRTSSPRPVPSYVDPSA